MRKGPMFAALAVLLIGILSGCAPSRPDLHATATPVPVTAAVPTATLPPLPTPSPELRISVPENLSAGDPYAPELGNAGYDVQHYTLRLTLDPATPVVAAQVTIDAVSTMDDLDQVSLDLVGYEIDEVAVAGSPALFFRREDKLVVDLPQPMARDAPFTLDVEYSGEPVAEPSAYVPAFSHLGLTYQPEGTLFVMAEPDGARYWFPCNDHPRDKATYRFELTVPQGLTGVANGVLVETQTGIPQAFPDGTPGDLYVWEHDYPLTSAFATVGVGDYRRVEGTSPGGIALRHYALPEHVAAVRSSSSVVGEMIDWMSGLFDAYPFEAFGYLVVSGRSSLETQTMVVLSVPDPNLGLEEGLMAHEMAHMWFGDWVSLDSWGDMWRSEGFATYVGIMWETGDDPQELQRLMDFWTERLGDDSDYPLNNPPPEALFSGYVYVRGAQLVHALRQEMGDEAFFTGLRTYFERYGGGTATHAEFQAVMEEAADISLEEFFASWFEG